MAMQGTFMKVFNLWGNYKNILGSNNRCSFMGLQQIAGLKKQTMEEKYNVPPKPKRPLTPYFKFMAQLRPELNKENPKPSVTEIVRLAAQRWEKVDAQLKQKLEEDYKKEQEIYAIERFHFDANLTEDQKNAYKQARIDKNEAKEKKIRKKKSKNFNKPKKPCSAYVMYLKTQKKYRGDLPFKEWQLEQSQKWHALSAEEKKPFMEQMKDEFKEYQMKMLQWEREMIKLGHTDIVRLDSLMEPKPTKKSVKKE